MKAFLEEATQEYDLILVDALPILPFTDACVLAPHVNGVFHVVRAGLVTPDNTIRARSLLGAVNARVVGTILNGVQSRNGFDYSSYYGYYRGSLGSSGDQIRGCFTRNARRLLTDIKRI